MEDESSYRVQNELRKETGHKEAGNNTGKAGLRVERRLGKVLRGVAGSHCCENLALQVCPVWI